MKNLSKLCMPALVTVILAACSKTCYTAVPSVSGGDGTIGSSSVRWDAIASLLKHSKPEIMNTNRGSQFASAAFIGVLKHSGINISMDDKGGWRNNVFIERLWKPDNYAEAYLHFYETISDARASLKRYFDVYNRRRLHSALDGKTLGMAYFDQPLQNIVAWKRSHLSMSLPFGLLGLLTYQDSTGYDLTKIFEDSLNNFWHAQSSQIYRELNKMEKLGWVRSQSIVQDGRPNKRLYSITDAGRSELAKWLADAKVEFENPHSTVLMRIFFGADAPETTLALLRQCRDQYKNALGGNYSNIQEKIEKYSTLIDNGDKKKKYWMMAFEIGVAGQIAIIEWAERCIAQIEKEISE